MSSMKLGIRIRLTKRADTEAIYVEVDSFENSGMLISYFSMKSLLILMTITGVTRIIEAKSRNIQRMADLVLLNIESLV